MTQNDPSKRAANKKQPADTLRLHFKPHDDLDHVDDPLPEDISAVAVTGRTLFTVCDETASVERLVRVSNGDYHQQESIALGDIFKLPDGRLGEMDIEGLEIDDGFLWITGSHSLKRDKAKPSSQSHRENVDELADIDRDPNRYFLGRLPLTMGRGGVHHVDRSKQAKSGKNGAACLKMKSKGKNKLTKLLSKDRHLGPSIAIPSKENGFDIEGLAASGDRLLLGLRGPVLRGWAVIIEVQVKVPKPGRLKLRKCGPKGRRYIKHFLPLEGLGIRDLRFDGDDLLVLAGPTMDHDGIGALFRWRSPLGSTKDRVHALEKVEHIMDFPYMRGADQAEGICWIKHKGKNHLITVYDSPRPERLSEDGLSLVADLFDLQNRSGDAKS